MPRHFTIAEAERLLPQVERAIREAIRVKTAYDEVEEELSGTLNRLAQLGGVQLDRDRFVRLKANRDEAAQRVRDAIEEVHEYGCELKDLDIGLIDFRSYYRGEEVYLCWKLGEDGIGFWHGLEDGYRGRKPIDEDFRLHHQGDRPQ